MRNLLLLAFLCGCATPDEQVVQSQRDIYEEVAPKFATYVATDERLTVEQKEREARTLAVWELLIRTQEEALQR